MTNPQEEAYRQIEADLRELRDTTPIVLQRKHFDRLLASLPLLKPQQPQVSTRLAVSERDKNCVRTADQKARVFYMEQADMVAHGLTAQDIVDGYNTGCQQLQAEYVKGRYLGNGEYEAVPKQPQVSVEEIESAICQHFDDNAAWSKKSLAKYIASALTHQGVTAREQSKKGSGGCDAKVSNME